MEQEMLTVLGIDPGTSVTGYGVIHSCSDRHTAIDFGCIRPPPKKLLSERYLIIFEGVSALLDKYRPGAMAIETQFVSKKPQSALKLGMARGVALLAAVQRGVPVYEYAPRRAKKAVVGTGSAGKGQVQKMMQILLGLPAPPTPEDAADALALALCHAQSIGGRKNLQQAVRI